MKSFQFTLNETSYWIDLFKDGYAWTNGRYESNSFFTTILEAQQDALIHAHNKRIDAMLAAEDEIDDAKYGGYEDQVNQFWKGTRI